jgi:predicted RNA methylase
MGEFAMIARHASDISALELARAPVDAADRGLLEALVALSRERIGFFPATASRTVEYPWFAKRLARHAGATVIDVGAGVCVLPFWLAGQDCQVVTIDSHPTARDVRDRAGWNEWGFLDYGRLDARIVSHRIDAAAFEPAAPAAAVYSVSVLEHMPAAVRRAVVGRLPGWLVPGGRVYLSFDLVPGTEDLWPLSEGRVVESAGLHGTFADVQSELRAAGLAVVEVCVVRSIPGNRTDVAFFEGVVA